LTGITLRVIADAAVLHISLSPTLRSAPLSYAPVQRHVRTLDLVSYTSSHSLLRFRSIKSLDWPFR